MDLKQEHKEMKREVNILEEKRKEDRGSVSWQLLKDAKKLKLKAKEKLNEIKSNNFVFKRNDSAHKRLFVRVLVIIPSEDHMNNLKALCENVLQKVRDHYGKVVTISSGYRSPELCEAIGFKQKFTARQRPGGRF